MLRLSPPYTAAVTPLLERMHTLQSTTNAPLRSFPSASSSMIYWVSFSSTPPPFTQTADSHCFPWHDVNLYHGHECEAY
uniref:Uncharacterized protein n=1 Tax=Physcomitrium patens TaxID=3218 RepID=A0A7I4DHC2_PHYPA